MLLKKLRLKNYRSFKNVELRLGDFNVLVGLNNSGKNALLDACKFLKQFVACSSFSSRDCWLGRNPAHIRSYWAEKSAAISFEYVCEEQGFGGKVHEMNYSLSLVGEEGNLRAQYEELLVDQLSVVARTTSGKIEGIGEDCQAISIMSRGADDYSFLHRLSEEGLTPNSPSGLPEFQFKDKAKSFIEFAQNIQSYNFRSEAISQWIRPTATSIGDLDYNGGNLANILEQLRDESYEKFAEIESAIKKVIPECLGITFERRTVKETFPNSEDDVLEKRLAFRLKFGDSVVNLAADEVSDGLLYFAAFATLVKIADKASLILVEEPEKGIHPSRLRDILTWLRQLVESSKDCSRNALATQVIITTHSPYLLDCCDPSEITVLHKSSSGETLLGRMDKVKDIDRLLAEFQPGELWTALTEEQIIKKAKL